MFRPCVKIGMIAWSLGAALPSLWEQHCLVAESRQCCSLAAGLPALWLQACLWIFPQHFQPEEKAFDKTIHHVAV